MTQTKTTRTTSQTNYLTNISLQDILYKNNDTDDIYYEKLAQCYKNALNEHIMSDNEIIKNCNIITMSKIMNLFAKYDLNFTKLECMTPEYILMRCRDWNKKHNKITA